MMHIAIVEDFVFDQKHLIDLIQKNFEEHGEMADFTCYESGEGAVALANIFFWAAALLYAQMGAKSVVISPPSLINTVHSQTSLSACLISNCFVFNH